MSEMDRLAELFENRLEKIAMLNDFISIFGQRAELLSQLRETNTQNDENRELLIQCRLRLQQFRTSVLPRARVELARMDRLQGCMLNMIEELDNREAESVDTAVPNKTMQFLTVSAAGNKENHNPQTPNSVRVSCPRSICKKIYLPLIPAFSPRLGCCSPTTRTHRLRPA